MLNENIKAIRKSKGLSQEELAVKLNVVRQTVSKWENGLSVPDSDMLISISEVLATPVSTLLGENVDEPKADINKKESKENMNKKTKGIVIRICVLLFVFLVIFAMYAGTVIGTDIGEFIYNITH